MIFIYVRHGRPIYNPDKLTPAGHRQADAVSKRLARFGIDRIFASSSNRAIETATPTADLCGREVEILDWCNESYAWHYTARPNGRGGDSWVFQNPDYLRKFSLPEVVALGDEWYTHPLFEEDHFAEGVETVNRHVDELFASLGYVHDRETHSYSAVRHNDDRVALFAHQGMGALFLSSVLDIPYPLFSSRFDMTFTGVTAIEFRPLRDDIVFPLVVTYDNDAHLVADGLPTEFSYRIRL